MTEVLWLRRDLRLHDHPALTAALARGGALLPVFCLDERLLRGRHRSGPRTRFLFESLRELARLLEERGSRLIVRRGRPEDVLVSLAREARAGCVHLTADVGPFALRRDACAERALRRAGVSVERHPGLFVADDPAGIRTQSGGAYTVFSPYHRAWLREPRRPVLPAPQELPPVPRHVDTSVLPQLGELGLRSDVEPPFAGGEPEARQHMRAFLEGGVADYGSRRDQLEGSSRLSPYLHLGCISARDLEQCLPAGAGPEEFRRQLCWRDFYGQVLRQFPANARSEHQRRYRGTIRWSHARGRFEAWCEGRTGFPLIDAAMRQLRCEGWIHNRARLAVASFLAKDLGIDWRWGERWFMRLLLDGDEASNNGNWQWIASVGVDPQPPARRIYNPSRQQARLDPTGAYVRRYVPELGQVPDRYLAEPWRMPDEVQAEVGCTIGRDYPAPIVDHLEARRGAIARYAVGAG